VGKNRVYRTVSPAASKWFDEVWRSGVLNKLTDNGLLIETLRADPVDPEITDLLSSGAAEVLSHPRLPFISYPYEWPFAALQAAALAHLRMHQEALDQGFTLCDASAFNMQFRRGAAFHIDVLSVVPYKEGSIFAGYGQFQRQFLNPLVLESVTGVSFAPFFRATLDGISSDDLFRLVPLRRLIKPSYLLHIVATALYGRRASRGELPSKIAPLPKQRLVGMLRHLESTIAGIRSRHNRLAQWQDYETTNTYAGEEREAKHREVAAFCTKVRPTEIIDVGCNAGEYSFAALENGALRAIGIDLDRAALDTAFERAVARRLDFLPLALDITNPSPGQGWRGLERSSFHARNRSDALLALAVIHHMVIGRNIPVRDAIEGLVALAPRGLIEFVPKSDPQVGKLLRLREDIFPDYRLEVFRSELERLATIVSDRQITASGRRLFWYERRA
jgi:SAM-dependent methyltransferase